MHPNLLPALACLSALALAVPAGAQNPPFRTSLIGDFDQFGSVYADVWGAGNFAYVAHFGQAEVDIVDISNPANPVLAANYPIPGDAGASAQDVKVANGLLFIALENTTNAGVQIVDVRNPFRPQFLTNVTPSVGFFSIVHNLYYDNGWLYLANSRDNTISIVDLRTYDPDAAPTLITRSAYTVTGAGNQFVHDITVQRGRLFASAWDSLRVYDVSNLGASPPVLLGSVRGLSSHSVWATDDGQFVVTAEERQGGAVRLFEVIPDGGGVDFIQRDAIVQALNDAFSSHNPIIVGDRVYVSHYQRGGLIYELDRQTKRLEMVASYDTTSAGGGFEGNWGTHPMLGEDKVLLSDIDEGLFIVDMSAIEIDFPSGRPDLAAPQQANPIHVALHGTGNAVVDDGSVTLWARVDGGAFQAIPMAALGGDEFEASLPTVGCGQRVEYYVYAEDAFGRSFTDPALAPRALHVAYAGSSTVTIFSDEFETNLGWTVSNQSVSTGAWVRVDPNGTGAAPEAGDDAGAGNQAYVTGNGSPGGSDGDQDMDGGPTRLLSPTLDFSGGDGLIRYSRWFYNDDADADDMLVEISNNGGGSWTTVEDVTLGAGGWIRRVIRVSDFVAPTANVRLRFSVQDNPNDSLTEGGVDAVSAERILCDVVMASATIENGTGQNVVAYTSQTLPILGATWRAQVDATHHAGARSTFILAHAAFLGVPQNFPFGELIIDLGSPAVASLSLPTVGGVSNYSTPLPNDAAFAGIELATQAVIFGGGVELVNAIELVLGY